MLQNDLYTLSDWQTSETAAQATLTLRWDHPVFQGHFPGQPVLPGACMMQMIKEILETAVHHRLRLIQAPAMKFPKMVIPGYGTTLQATLSWQWIEDDSLRVKAGLSMAEKPCFSFTGTFRPQQ